MPRISQRKALIEWFLGGIERHQAHLDQERFQDFLRRMMRQLQQGLDKAMNMVEPSGDDDSSVTCTVTVTVTISESDKSDSMSSLLSSEWDDDDEVDHEMEMQHKLRGLQAVLAKRYLRERGGFIYICPSNLAQFSLDDWRLGSEPTQKPTSEIGRLIRHFARLQNGVLKPRTSKPRKNPD
ncbi:hypothetical protein EV426DRAFT_644322 [Tirmania nivea]|nr:hypothetical protein EV426DRAFT_644322 [Tirmania nivea]